MLFNKLLLMLAIYQITEFFKFQVKVMTIKDEFYIAHLSYECALIHFTVLFGGLKSDFTEQFTTFEREFSWSPLI